MQIYLYTLKKEGMQYFCRITSLRMKIRNNTFNFEEQYFYLLEYGKKLRRYFIRLKTNMFMSIRMNIKTNIFAIRELSNYM